MTDPNNPAAEPAAPASPDVVVNDVKGGDQVTVGDGQQPPSNDPAPMGQAGTPQMPEGGHEKYWNAEKGEYNWEAHAREMAWKQGQKGQQDDPAADDPYSSAGPAPTADADQAAMDAAESAGIDFNEFNNHVLENREPSEEHLKALEAAGIPRDVVQDYVQMKLEAVERHISAVTDFLGGETGVANLKQHLANNYTEAEIEAFDAQLANPGTWRVTAAYLLADAGLPQGGRGLIKGTNAPPSPSTGGESFQTEAEFNAAMRDPRYKSDPQYRTRVENALRNSPHLMGRAASHSL